MLYFTKCRVTSHFQKSIHLHQYQSKTKHYNIAEHMQSVLTSNPAKQQAEYIKGQNKIAALILLMLIKFNVIFRF